MPKYTCPVIDRLKGVIETAFKLADNIPNWVDGVEELRDYIEDIAHELSGEADALEEIREANSALRDCAVYWEEKASELEDTIANIQEGSGSV